jgi:hypothetical protein
MQIFSLTIKASIVIQQGSMWLLGMCLVVLKITLLKSLIKDIQMEARENSSMSVYEVFKKFKERFLGEKKSIFSDAEEEIFTLENVNFIVENFNKKPNENSEMDFDQKIGDQLKNANPSQRILFAHAVWLWSVFAYDMKQEGKVKGVNNWIESWVNNGIIPDHGVGSTGQYHKTNKPSEIAYIINFFEKLIIDNSEKDYVRTVKAIGSAVKVGNSERKVAMYNILLHLFAPEEYERIASYGHKEKIVGFFDSIYEDIEYPIDADLDDKLKLIRNKCEADSRFKEMTLFLNNRDKFDFYNPSLESLWKNEIILESKNMILHGAPGTGKTYGVENSIKKRLEYLKDQDAANQYTLVQFHPSYGYEDFIDGIKPAGIDSGGTLKLELKNGRFKEICIEAFKELINADKEKMKKIKKFYFVADEVNRAELSRVFGELLLCIEEDKRLSVKDGVVYGTKVKTQNSCLWKKEHAVVVLNGQGELDDSGKDFYFGIPENLYFIGTMNDIDRSVDSFDMALRRRFFWKHYECNYEVILDKYSVSDPAKVERYDLICKKLNNHIVSENGFNLGESYQLGHSYFLKPTKINKDQLNKVWENNIAPLLKEYLRAEYNESDIKKHLVKAKDLFKID